MIIPVILASNQDTRLWPLSRRSFPKQFTALVDDQSLFQMTAKRWNRSGFLSPMVVTRSEYRFIAVEQMEQADVVAGPILIEPVARGAGTCALAAAIAHAATPDAVLLITPSDVIVSDEAAFLADVEGAKTSVKDGNVVTIGTSGVYLARVDTVLDAFKSVPQTLTAARAAVQQATRDMCFTRLSESSWKQCERIEIKDVLSAELENFVTIEPQSHCTEMSDWHSFGQLFDSDRNGNVVGKGATAVGCSDSILQSGDPSLKVIGVGLEGITAIATGDAVLVTQTDNSASMEIALEQLSFENSPQIDTHKKQIRPWGHFETLSLGKRFQVKSIMVKPGAALSLQSHMHRAEHWVVVEGSAQVTVDEKSDLISENGAVYIPLGAIHRLENPGKLPLHLIEVQSGCYLGEDDITRYEDVYCRDIAKSAA
jgi:mannose-1-phosphate guanylyltransferase/mannose-6-phosphate isomerase-like protein (cupin superfamily)